MKSHFLLISLCLVSLTALADNHMASDRISDIRNTKHNFASNDFVQLPNGDSRDVVSSENRICIFCHTPHGDPLKAAKPFLWNRTDSDGLMDDMYTSSTLNINNASVSLGDKSKMCLSCHDGTVAIGQLDMINSGSDIGPPISTVPSSVTMSGNNISAGELIGSSILGTTYADDHPVGFVYDGALATADEELLDPTAVNHIGVRASGQVTRFNKAIADAGSDGAAGADNPTTSATRIAVPLESSVTAPTNGQTTFVSVATSGSVECTTCHDPHIRSTNVDENIKFLRLHRFQKKTPADRPFEIDEDINCLACHKKSGWAGSVHAKDTTADNFIGTTEAGLKEWPNGTQVWEASCMSCHATHTASGNTHLLAEADIEQTCYQCHGISSVLESGSEAADIETVELSNPHGTSGTIDNTTHIVRSANMEESGVDLQNRRHVVCTDCHSPHRAVKNTVYDESGIDTQATHVHDATAVHSNIASGALRGVMGVEPDYTTTGETFAPFDSTLTFSGQTVSIDDESPATNTYDVLQDDISTNADTSQIVTKEYQVCLKCHSPYGITAADLAAMTKRNIAMEFQPELNTRVTKGNNQNSWHPVTASTNRAGDVVVASNFVTPFDQGIGSQTMYCSDCHNNDTSGAKGPHGSANDNLLIAPYNVNTGDATPTDLCFSCHKFSAYANKDTPNDASVTSNFSGAGFENLHIRHAAITNSGADPQPYTCSLCHVARPHGWKNRALLIDLSAGVADAVLDPLYHTAQARLSIDNYSDPGAWVKMDCNSSSCHTP